MANKIVPSPRGIWLRTHLAREGNWLTGTVYLIAAGQPEVFSIRVDLARIARIVKSYHQKLHRAAVGCAECQYKIAGLFSGLGKLVKRIGRIKLFKGISRAVKGIVKNKVVQGLVATTAVVFPPVGAPAAAALASANVALKAYETGDKIAKGAQAAAKTLTKAKSIAKAAVRLSAFRKVPVKSVLTPRAKGILNSAVTIRRKFRSTGKKAKQEMVNKVSQYKKSKDLFANIVKNSRSTNPEKRAEALKSAQIIQVVAQHRARMLALAGKMPTGQTGLVIDAHGKAIPGKWAINAAAKGAATALLLAPSGKVTRGYWQRVGGCIGCE